MALPLVRQSVSTTAQPATPMLPGLVKTPKERGKVRTKPRGAKRAAVEDEAVETTSFEPRGTRNTMSLNFWPRTILRTFSQQSRNKNCVSSSEHELGPEGHAQDERMTEFEANARAPTQAQIWGGGA